jgi:hypothetical protein
MDDTIKPLADAIYADKVRRARRLSIAERIGTGFELFEGAVGLMRDGVHSQHPSMAAPEVDALIRRRLRRLRQVADFAVYRPVV